MLFVLLLGIADFGRVFTAGITVEAASRNAAEIVAVERLRDPPPPPGDPTEIAYYERLHQLGASTACSTARQLPNTTFDSSSSACAEMPVVGVCIHDGQDPLCGAPIAGFAATIPSECGSVEALRDNPDNTSGGEVASHFVEVRLCYHFTTLFNLQLSLPMSAGLSLGDVWIERDRSFVVDCLPAQVSTC
jgi:hypothetical protein